MWASKKADAQLPGSRLQNVRMVGKKFHQFLTASFSNYNSQRLLKLGHKTDGYLHWLDLIMMAEILCSLTRRKVPTLQLTKENMQMWPLQSHMRSPAASLMLITCKMTNFCYWWYKATPGCAIDHFSVGTRALAVTISLPGAVTCWSAISFIIWIFNFSF